MPEDLRAEAALRAAPAPGFRQFLRSATMQVPMRPMISLRPDRWASGGEPVKLARGGLRPRLGLALPPLRATVCR